MKIARFAITPHLLFEVFSLPLDTKLVAASLDDCGNLQLEVEHDELADQPDGFVGLASPQFEEAKPVRFLNWGQE